MTTIQSPRGILLDIEGTTSSISFVHDVMFPFVLDRLHDFLATEFEREDVKEACQQIARDAGHTTLDAWQATFSGACIKELVAGEVRRLMDGDIKATGLKALQGLIWDSGFRSGELKAHIYPDVLPAIQQWIDAGIDVRIYSSGSIVAQKLFFGHVEGQGDCLSLFSGHYDTTIGSKKEAESYTRVAADWGLNHDEILFVSDLAAELEAAKNAGFQVAASIRPGNQELPESLDVARVTSFAQLQDILAS